jgi:Uma2 family endonuclease
MASDPIRHLFTTAEYHAMSEAGILPPEDRFELLEGEIYQMPPIGSRHAGCVNWLNRTFVRRLDDRAVLAPQNPVVLSDVSEPQPDIVLLRPRADDYRESHPTTADVLLIVEVADSTLPFDRRKKGPLYARCAIPEVWIVNLVDGEHEVYRDPSPQGYRTVRRLGREERIAPLAFPDVELAVGKILGQSASSASL